jgi:hypothetical protein
MRMKKLEKNQMKEIQGGVSVHYWKGGYTSCYHATYSRVTQCESCYDGGRGCITGLYHW